MGPLEGLALSTHRRGHGRISMADK
jgi:hypothetical protein